ncbi:MAG: dihydroxyacetone kinase subunit DhaK [Propionibacteriaceae bacterium]|jgi:dihydroxyacetone kinase-like protein|nr:dihydroxyacetone kinase subunit DhaK [Propionibacteriaceae bacterium]
MKKLINDASAVVTDFLAGFAAAHDDLVQVDHENRVVYRLGGAKEGKVGLVSGGGSGHEPLHGGFVGFGMLDAACCGEVFTSPVPDQVFAATQEVDSGAGVLHIVKNYTGDIMNFEMAAEMAAAEGITVEAVVVNDDVAVQDSLYTAGRRGVGLTVLLEKIVGAAAEDGMHLLALKELAERVIANGRSMGMALTSVTVPAAGKPTFELADDEIELGIGIHGEPGRERRKITTAAETAELMLKPILDDIDYRGSEVIAFVNGMGGTPLMELYVMYNEVRRVLEANGVRIVRDLVGNYITSLEMAGCSITLLKADEEMIKYWDAPVVTPGLRKGQ